MCGIAGIIDFKGRDIDTQVLDEMTRALVHRGPDGTATRVMRCRTCSVGLGHTRLKVIDTSDRADQPMGARRWIESAGDLVPDPESRHWLLYNGEIYNFQALRRDLVAEGIRFRSRSDTEVLLRACLQWGDAAFDRFNGMWALCLIDENTGCGMLSRDRFGIKPLYWLFRDGRLCFASETRSLLCLPDLQRRIDPAALELYLRLGYCPDPHSLIQGVQTLPPGHHLHFSPDGPDEPKRYFRLKAPPAPSDYEESAHELRRRIERAVVERMAADVPLGAFLSGGIDSSIIVAHMAENAPGRVRTFSIGFADQPRYDESRYARQLARLFDTDHTEHKVTCDQALADIPDLLDHLGEPFGDSSLLPTAILSRLTRRHVTVALSGDAGDELFAGYWRYRGHHALERYRKWPAFLRRSLVQPGVNHLSAGRYGAAANRSRQLQKLLRAESPPFASHARDPLAAHLAWAHILSPARADLFRDAGTYERGIDALLDHFRVAVRDGCDMDNPEPDPLNEILLADLFVGLPGDMLRKVDLASMRCGLEVRVPFLDPTVVEFAAAMPSAFKLANGRGKRILTDAYRGLIPDDILHRPKMGFELPIGEWFRGPLHDLFRDTVTRDAIESCERINYAAVERAFDDHRNRRADHSELLWSLLSLCRWWRQ